MNRNVLIAIATATLLSIAGAGGYWAGQRQAGHAEPAMAQAPVTTNGERRVLYWYDPMYPQQRFDQPGKSPFMDMQLVPKYADEDSDGGVRIDPVLAQNLGIRIAPVETGRLASNLEAVASVSFNERDVAIVQARTGGFVERVHPLAPGDIVRAGATLAEVLVPEWTAAQREFLALKTTGDETLTRAARERLKLLGMPGDLIERVEASGEPRAVVPVTTPVGGVIQSLDVRPGMTVTPGMTLARINGLATVWLEAAVPESQAGALRPGAPVEARLAAFPGEMFKGKVAAILPEADTQTRTLRVRAELPNRNLKLKPGMFAQMRFAFDAAKDAVLVPTEAVIPTGTRTLVIVAEEGNRFVPVEVQTGQEANGKTAILRGLTAGQRVVTSGQFLIDSEASLTGALNRLESTGPTPATQSAVHDAEGKIIELNRDTVVLAHGPVPSMNWGPMEMPFALARPDIAKGLKAGDRIKFGFRQGNDGFVVERMERLP